MTIKNLYRYEEQDGSITVTPNKRDPADIPAFYRLIADEGYDLIHGDDEDTRCYCVDVNVGEESEWNEVEIIPDEYTEAIDPVEMGRTYHEGEEIPVEPYDDYYNGGMNDGN